MLKGGKLLGKAGFFSFLSSVLFHWGFTDMSDGSLSTRWTPMPAKAPGMYCRVDMGKVHEIFGVHLCQGDSWRDWPRGLAGHVSTDGEGAPAGKCSGGRSTSL